MKVLVGCEESQEVCKAFRALGHEAYSCDIQECSGGHPEWHFKMDVFEAIKLMDWDVGIFFPPCTDIAASGAAWFEEKIKDGRQQKSIDFFMKITNSPIKRMCIENPVGIMSTLFRKPDQIVHPYYFGDEAQKTTCLWLKNLPKLFHAKQVDLFCENITHVGRGEMILCKRKNGKTEMRSKHNQGLPPSEDRGKIRSKTFPGIAKAMAEQWGNLENI